MNKALFLDRDGVLNLDKGYVYQWSELVWINEIFDIIKLANERGYKVIVLTNQVFVVVCIKKKMFVSCTNKCMPI